MADVPVRSRSFFGERRGAGRRNISASAARRRTQAIVLARGHITKERWVTVGQGTGFTLLAFRPCSNKPGSSALRQI